jgi:hypothetical protein
MSNAIKIEVTFPYSRLTYKFKSVRAVARMLSGDGPASGGLRHQISLASTVPAEVRNNLVDSFLRENIEAVFGIAA